MHDDVFISSRLVRAWSKILLALIVCFDAHVLTHVHFNHFSQIITKTGTAASKLKVKLLSCLKV